MMLFLKDRFNVSGLAYHEMAKVCRSMPCHYKIRERIRELNQLWDIQPTPNGTCGVQQSLKDHLLLSVRNLLTCSTEDAPFRQQFMLNYQEMVQI